MTNHSHDNAQLGVHDVETAMTDIAVVNGASVATYDVASLNANLVLPHEKMHAHAVI
ncbi:hypothetical protein [Dyella koreensis]|uniref:Uncharacterized protein n=1 Tax=Dyella koreensis TaxID=311235 RepID=A0ABW8JZH2_9GAMM